MKGKRLKRILAWIAIVLLAGLYITTAVMAVLVTPNTIRMFRTSIMATIIIPIMIYVIMFIYRLIHPEHMEEMIVEDSGEEETVSESVSGENVVRGSSEECLEDQK